MFLTVPRHPLPLLLVEDSEDDALRVIDELRRQGFEPEFTRITSAAEFEKALDSQEFKLILCDCMMPGFYAVEALEILRSRGEDIPLIIVSGSVGEEDAVEAMRSGAADYIPKTNLARLGAVVDRELREAECRNLKRMSDRFAESQSEVVEMILKRLPLAEILDCIVLRLESLSAEKVFCSILLSNEEGTHLELASAPSLPADFQKAVCLVPIGEGIGTCGAVAALGEVVVVDDIATHPNWEAFRDFALRDGLRACWSAPIFTSGGVVLGALSVYHQKSHSPDREELSWVEASTKLVSLAIERSRNLEKLQASEIRYLSQRNALIDMARAQPRNSGEIDGALRRITEIAAETLIVARVSIWRFTEDREAMDCVDLYELETGLHSSGMKFPTLEFSNYFQGLEEVELIVADDAQNNPFTSAFAEEYLTPYGITSLIDVPLRLGQAVEYLICLEHIGPARRWTPDEKTFAVAVTNIVSLALEAHERFKAEEEVLKSHQRFQSVAAATNDTIWDWDLTTDEFWWSDGYAKLFGWTAKGNQPTVRTWIRQVHPEDRRRVVSGIFHAIESGKTHWAEEYRFLSNDGTLSHVFDRGEIIRDADGKGVRMVGGMSDLTEQKLAQNELARTNRALQMLSSCNKLLIHATGEAMLLSDVCRLAVDIGGYRMAWVGYASDGEDGIISMANAGEGSEVLAAMENLCEGESPARKAIRTGEVVMCEDIADSDTFNHWRSSSKLLCYQSVFCLPLTNNGGTFGVIVLFAASPESVGIDELQLLMQMANDLSFGIENIRVRDERQRAQDVVLKVAQAVSTSGGDEFFDLLTRNMVEALGADGGGIGRFDEGGYSVHSLSFYLDGHRMDPISYNLAGTPCAHVIAGNVCIFEKDVRGLFPDDEMLAIFDIESYAGIPLFDSKERPAGIMLVFFHRPIKETTLVKSTLKIFAARAAAEIERRTADARIREQASLLDMAQDAIIARDLENRVTYWNKSAERLYGWTAKEALGQSVKEMLHRDADHFETAYQQTLRTGDWVGEMNHCTKESRLLTIVSRWTLVHNSLGEPSGILMINTDVSEHRKLEQQFLRAQRLESIGTLAGGIAHDLNNILAPISMAIDLLKMRNTDPRNPELLETIAASARRGTEMVGQVLSFARGMEGRRVEVHPVRIIAEVEQIMRGSFLKGIALEVDASNDLWTILGDPTQLHQVLVNLCVNARDALSGNGVISISAENVEIDASFAAVNLEAKPGPHVCFVVKDNGTGMTPEVMEKIFDPFFTTKSVGKGTGLGLPTSLAIIKSHGGFIRVSSKLREGTLFRVYLPARPDLNQAEVLEEIPELPMGEGETILIVDDEAFIRQITQETLETFGYRTVVAANGEEALSAYQAAEGGIDVVLTDMMMPGMDGPQLIRAIMAINPAARIIATSGIAERKASAFSAGAGVKEFINKPCSAEVLLKSLRCVLKISNQ